MTAPKPHFFVIIAKSCGLLMTLSNTRALFEGALSEEGDRNENIGSKQMIVQP
ncbi:MAG: hypothetical protein AAFU78_04625 [Cyanobacteria bacterium J06633_2]